MTRWFDRLSSAMRRRHDRLPAPGLPGGDATPSLETLVQRADALRDSSDWAGAAEAYAEALRLAPWRTDLTVQQGNMCKDAGLMPDAERLYGIALEQDPENADIHLQLGHVMKLMGRRARAIACYRRALALDPFSRSARLELVQAGSVEHQAQAIASQVAAHGIERMMSVAAELATIRIRLEEIGAGLPDLATWTAIPVDRYDLFRRLHDHPPAPASERVDVLVVIGADGAPVERLHAVLRSLHRQSCDRWTAVVHGTGADRRAAVERLAVADHRLRWMQHEGGETSGEAERRAGKGANGTVLLLADGASLHARAVEWFGYAAASGEAPVICCDAELTHSGDRGDDVPVELVPRWGFDPELLLQRNVWGNTLCVTAAFWTALGAEVAALPALAARRSALLLAASSVAHVALPLVSFDVAGRELPLLPDHLVAVVQAMASRGPSAPAVGLPAGPTASGLEVLWPQPDVPGTITVIVPTRDNAADCAAMVGSLFEHADRPDLLECLVLDNGTRQGGNLAILAALADRPSVRVVSRPEAFNWSALNNAGAAMTNAAHLVFANDDMRMRTPGWDTSLRRLLVRPDVGAVGAKLLYPDATIQHGGILFGWQGSVIHDGLYEPEHSIGQMGRWQTRRQVNAVTGAFLCLNRELFLEIGGFDAVALPIGYSDVDLCLRLRAARRTVLWEPAIVVEHAESQTRGFDHLEREKQARDRSEFLAIRERWGSMTFARDRSVGPVWHDATLPFRLLAPVAAEQVCDHLRSNGPASGETKTWRASL